MSDAAKREWKCKAATDKTWANFKTHVSREIHDYQKERGLTAKPTHDLSNVANQPILQSQCDLREITEYFAEQMKHKFEKVLNATRISATQQQAHYAVQPK